MLPSLTQGGRLIGIYDSQVAFGQSRVLLVWTRLLMPNGRSIVLERQRRPDALARRHRRHRQSCKPQSRRCARGDVEAVGAKLLHLPPYSPDLNPIELAFAKFKTALRKAAERTVDELWRRIGIIIDDFSPQECQNYLRHDGYAST